MDFGSSERLGSWREDETRPGAGVRGDRGGVGDGGHLFRGGDDRAGAYRAIPVPLTDSPCTPCGSRAHPEPWEPRERLEQGPAQAPQIPAEEAHAAVAAGEGLHQRYWRDPASGAPVGSGARGADGPLPQTRCSAAHWRSCVSARGARCRASCSSASAPWRPAVRARRARWALPAPDPMMETPRMGAGGGRWRERPGASKLGS